MKIIWFSFMKDVKESCFALIGRQVQRYRRGHGFMLIVLPVDSDTLETGLF